MGIVYLVGAGPGDPGLISVKGKKVISQADCIIYDRLAAPELLDEAPAECERIYVGKRNHHHTMKQEDINELLVRKAKEYDCVVRLKGGDVYVFGRGGEEGIYLRERGVQFDVVPGISSALAGLAYAGIPITHRGVAMGFHVVTAHNKRDELADIDFEAMARGKDTCVFLMGLSKLAEIVQKLCSAGMRTDMPVAVVSHATMPEQRTCVGTLSSIVDRVEQAGLTSPALIAVGEVVNLREHLNTRENVIHPMQILIPRIGEESSELAEALRKLGAQVDEVKVGEIVSVPDAFSTEEFEAATWIVLTSKSGVEHFFEAVKRRQIDYRKFAGKRFAVVGSKTARYLRMHGFEADLVPDSFTGEALRESLMKMVTSSDVILYGMPVSEVKNESALKMLEEKCKVLHVALYENKACHFKLPEQDRKAYDCICFSCGSSVHRLWETIDGAMKEQLVSGRIKAVSIGPKTSEALRSHGVKQILQAEQSTYEGMKAVLYENGIE